MAYKKWNFDDPVEKDMSLFAVYNCGPDWGYVTYDLGDGNGEQKYEFKDETDFNKLYSTSLDDTSDFSFYGVKFTRAKLRKICVGRNIKEIKNNFCVNCHYRTEVELHDDIESIGNYFLAYRQYGGGNNNWFFTGNKLPLSLKTIGSGFLYYDSRYNNPLAFPDGLESIGSSFMTGYTSSGISSYTQRFNQDIILPDSVKSIGNNFLYYGNSFNSRIRLPKNLAAIPDYFMYNCKSFNQTITMPEECASIGRSFLGSCSVFNQPIIFPKGLKIIGDYFMSGCSVYNYPITPPDTVESIGVSFMGSCTKLNSAVYIPNNEKLTRINDSFLSSCNAFNQLLTIPDNIAEIGESFLSGCWAFDQLLKIPKKVTALANSFMSNCQAFNQPIMGNIIHENIVSLGTSFMYNCYVLNQPIELPKEMTSIPNSFISGWRSYNLPLDGVLREGITSIGSYFLSEAYVFNQPVEWPSTLTSLNGARLLYCARSFNQPFELPDCVSATLQSFMSGWYSFDANDIELPATVTTLTYGFSCLYSMTHNITIPATVTKISGYSSGVDELFGNYTFDGYEGLGFTGTLIMDSTALPTTSDNDYVLTSYKNNTPEITEGLKITGDAAELWMARYPNRLPDASRKYNFRNLILVDDPRELTLTRLANRIKAGKDVLIGTEVEDEWNGESNPLIVTQKLDSSNNEKYGGAVGYCLMRKYVSTETMAYSTSGQRNYALSDIYAYLGGDYLEKCSDELRSIISDISVTCDNSNVTTTSNFVLVPAKWFLMSENEIWSRAIGDGIKWDYWQEQTKLSKVSADSNTGRIGRDINGNVHTWWTRSRANADLSNAYRVNEQGGSMNRPLDELCTIRPACFISATSS